MNHLVCCAALVFLAASVSAADAQDKLPLVKVVATGGTIANTPSGRLNAGEVANARNRFLGDLLRVNSRGHGAGEDDGDK